MGKKDFIDSLTHLSHLRQGHVRSCGDSVVTWTPLLHPQHPFWGSIYA